MNQFDVFEIPSVSAAIGFSVAVGILCSIIAFYRGRLGLVWFFLGLLFSIFALIMVIALPSLKHGGKRASGRIKLEPPKICPHCRASNSRAFRFCIQCGRPFRKGLVTVAVYHFKIWNNRIGDWETPHAKRTAEDVAALNGLIIPDTMEMISDSELDSHGRYFPRDEITPDPPPEVTLQVHRPVDPSIKQTKP